MFCRKLFFSSVIRISARNQRHFSVFNGVKIEKKSILTTVSVPNCSGFGNNVCWQKIQIRHASYESTTGKLSNNSSTINFDADSLKENVLNRGDFSSKTSSSELGNDGFTIDNFLGDASTAVTDVNLDATVNAATEVLNLTTWLPPNGLYHFLSFLHESCPWWASIVIATCIARLAIFPLTISMQRKSTLMAKDSHKLLDIQNKVQQAILKQDEAAMAIYQKQLMDEMKKSIGSQLRFMWRPLLNGAIFSSFFFALREMANHPIASMKTGGLYWFTDLTVCDPYYILPFVTSSTLFYVFKSGIEFGGTNNPMMEMQLKWMSYILPPVTFLVMINFSTALCVYWCTNNFISLLQASLLRKDSVKRFFKIPILENSPKIKKDVTFKEGFNQTWNQAAFTQAVKERKELYEKITSIKRSK